MAVTLDLEALEALGDLGDLVDLVDLVAQEVQEAAHHHHHHHLGAHLAITTRLHITMTPRLALREAS